MGVSLENRVAIVTGAAQGIGKVTALLLAERGAHVSCWDIKGDLVKQTAVEIEAQGSRALGLETDVTDPKHVERSTQETMDAFGRIDILVNVAGGSMGAPPGIADLTAEDWDRVINLNLRAPFLTCKAVAGTMKKQGWGRIVNISSGAGRSVTRTGILPYAAGKAGLLGLTRQLAVDLAPHGVNVNAIAPGSINSHLNDDHIDTEGGQQDPSRLTTIPIGRFGVSEEIAAAVAFLASEDASYVVGQTLCVDGGHWMF